MNIHKNARLTFARRQELVVDMTAGHLSATLAAAKYGVSAPTARKWLGRFLVQGEAGLRDASSRPRRSPRAIAHTGRRTKRGARAVRATIGAGTGDGDRTASPAAFNRAGRVTRPRRE